MAHARRKRYERRDAGLRNEGSMEGLWFWITVIGPILLAAVMFYAWRKNKAQPRDEVRRSEQGAREYREQIDREENPNG